jgi:AraC-like DNA-binding protein
MIIKGKMLNKSSKNNLIYFHKVSFNKTPLQFIQERKLLEVKRQLKKYTNKSIKEIAYDIGFEDIHLQKWFFKIKKGNHHQI